MAFKRHKISLPAAAIMIFAAIVSCSPVDLDFEYSTGTVDRDYPNRIPSTSYRNVFLMYTAGYNNLSSAFDEDVNDIIGSNIPESSIDVLLIFSHRTASRGNYVTPTSPTLTRVSRNMEGKTVCDTLLVMEKGTPAASRETLNKVLSYVNEQYPADCYGMLFSSHGTGWMPANFEFNSTILWKAGGYETDDYGLRPQGLPAVRSVGYQNVTGGTALEIDIKDFAEAIPMHIDYLIFDACLMGGVEVAYQLKDKCSKVIFSAAEILADGMDYKTLTDYLINCTEPDLRGFTENYYNFYSDPSRPSSNRSGTIALIDCSHLEELAGVCRGIFDSYSSEISVLENRSNEVQKYFTRDAHKCFYDLEDIVIKSGAAQEDLSKLSNALDGCVMYCASTEKILGYVTVNHFCGLSMYLPLSKEAELNEYYKTLEWNIATGLVK